MTHVRVSIKAIIIQNERLLAIEARDASGTWYELPGGGQEAGETVLEALSRECREEIGSDVHVGALRFVRDYIADRHEFAAREGGIHQVELMFECRLVSTPDFSMVTVPDAHQTGIVWLELSALAGTRFYPRALIAALTSGAAPPTGPLYLGDVN